MAANAPLQKWGKYFSGKYHVKFGHFINFYTYIFWQKYLALPKLTELLYAFRLPPPAFIV